MAADHPSQPARRSTAVVHWICVALTLMVGVFLVADARAGNYGTAAWIGAAVAGFAILGLAVVYAACALGRIRLDKILSGRMTYLHVTIVGLALVIGADIFIPDREAGSLAILLPFGIAYWLNSVTAEN